MIIMLNVRRLDIRNKFQRYICPCKGVHLSWTRAQICKTHIFCWKYICPCKGVRTRCVQLHKPLKRWLEEVEAQVSKINSKGLDLFLAEYMRMIFKGWPHRKKVASPGQPSIDRTWWDKFKNFVSTRALQNAKHMFFCWGIHLSLQKATTTYVQLTPTKKVTWRGRGAGVKNKFQGAGPFLAEYMRMIFKGWPHRKKVASPGQPSIDRKWWDKFNNFVLTRAQNSKHMFFSLNIHLSLQKSTTTYVQLHQPKRWLEEAEAQVSKIKSKGLDLFLAEYMRMIFKGWPHRKKVASPGQPSIDRKWWDKFKNFVSTRAQNAKHMFFLLKIHLS